MKRLSKEQILLLHQQLLEHFGGLDGIRDEALLESALHAPFHSFSDQKLYPSVEEKIARLSFGLASNHPFIDGNKRIAAHTLLVSLAINNIHIEYTQEELIELYLAVASSTKGYDEILDFIQTHRRHE